MLKWKRVTKETTWRLKVIGGWIVKSGVSDAVGLGMVFISDPKHIWEIEYET